MEDQLIDTMGLNNANVADTTRGKYLIVVLGDQYFGIPVANVVQIVGVQEIVGVPEMPYYAKGVINLRGSIIPVVDTRLRLGLSEIEHTDRTCIIIAAMGTRIMGFIVDSVDEVTDIPDEEMLPPPHSDTERFSFINGVCKLGTRIVLRLAMELVFNSDGMSSLYSQEA